MRSIKYDAARLLGVALAGVLAACGGGDGGPGTCPAGQMGVPPNCAPILQPCQQDVLDSGGGAHPASTLAFYDFSVPRSGRLDITVDWTDPASPIGVYLVPVGTCTLDEFNARSCDFVVRSEPSPMKPRKISSGGFAAGNYRWLIASYSDVDESVSYQIVLSTGDNCPALGGAAPSASSAGDPAGRAVEHAMPR